MARKTSTAPATQHSPAGTPTTARANGATNAGGIGLATKTCGRCHTDKPRTDFMKASSQRDGLDRWCKPCCADYQREWRARKLAAKATTPAQLAAAANVLEGKPGLYGAADFEDHSGCRQYGATGAGVTCPDCAAEAAEAAEAAAQPAGLGIPPVPDDPAVVATPEGQAALEAAAEAAKAARRAAWAEAKRRQRAQAKANEAVANGYVPGANR